jgi:hypothetical protein
LIIADSSVWIDFFRGSDSAHVAALARELDEDNVAIADLVLMEVLRGVRTEATVSGLLDFFGDLSLLNIATTEMCLKAAEYYRTLRRRGITIRSTVDCLIATYCIEHGYELLHRDRDYDAFETHLGLQVVRAS